MKKTENIDMEKVIEFETAYTTLKGFLYDIHLQETDTDSKICNEAYKQERNLRTVINFIKGHKNWNKK